MLTTILNYSIYNNTGKDYLIALVIFLLSLILLKIIKRVLIDKLQKIAKKTKTDIDDTIVEIFKNIKPPFYFLFSLYLGIQFLKLNTIVNQSVRALFLIALIYESIIALQKIIEYITYIAIKKNGKDDQSAKATIKTLSIVIKIVLWSFGLIIILSNIGINISSLLAGLGIGGIAVALALQNILSDIFSSFSILIDKPFEVGDFIKIGNDLGTVEKIGIKTTRLRALDGQLLIVANKELTTARVQNFKKLKKRRALLKIGVTYETDSDKLKEIPKIIEEIIKKQKLAEFNRCHFKSFGDFSLNFEIVFYVNSTDYLEYMNTLEKVNLDIFEAFSNRKIDFAYPTNLIYKKDI